MLCQIKHAYALKLMGDSSVKCVTFGEQISYSFPHFLGMLALGPSITYKYNAQIPTNHVALELIFNPSPGSKELCFKVA